MPSENCNCVDCHSDNVVFRKSKTVLPHWLDKTIFNEHGAIYAPEHVRYEYNLKLNAEELKAYLGTYFPRSYAEMFCITDNLLQNKSFGKRLDLSEINILDCGSGTGGEVIGLITAIVKYLSPKKINVTAIDGNKGALGILSDIVKRFPNKSVEVQLSTIVQTIITEDDLEVLDSLNDNYHFILCNKMVCELISKKVLSSDAYTIMATSLASHLNKDGLLVILDVTTKDVLTGFYYPQLMNSSLNDYVRQNATIQTLLPLSCSCNEECANLCFMQQTFYVSHSHKSNDESRVCYRILCHESLKSEIMQNLNIKDKEHIIHPIKFKQNDKSSICILTRNNETAIDTFNINL